MGKYISETAANVARGVSARGEWKVESASIAGTMAGNVCPPGHDIPKSQSPCSSAKRTSANIQFRGPAAALA